MEMVLGLPEKVVLGVVEVVGLGVMDEVSSKTGTKDLVTIMIQDMEIIIVPKVVVNTMAAMAVVLILGRTLATMDMDGQGYTDHRGQQSTYDEASERSGNPKTITIHTKGGCGRK